MNHCEYAYEDCLVFRGLSLYLCLLHPKMKRPYLDPFLLLSPLLYIHTSLQEKMRVFTSLALCTLIVNWTLTLLAFFAVIVVYWHRHRLASRGQLRVRTDDILLTVSFSVGVVLVSLSTWGILDEGQAEHQYNVSDSHLERAAKVSLSLDFSTQSTGSLLRGHLDCADGSGSYSLLVAEALWNLVTGLLRIAACLLLHELFSIKKLAGLTTVTIILVSAGLAAASIIQIFLICKPFAAQWDPCILGSCGDQVVSFMALESVGLVLDLGILIIPTVSIMRLMVLWRRRMQLIFIFNIGAV